MKTIKLKNIELTDWKGQSNTLCFDGKTSVIEGRNGIGKSSVYMAFCWLLTGYTDSINPKNHELFDDKAAVSENTPMASVCAVIDVDGEDVELFRGAQPQFSSNKMDGTYTKMSSDKYTFRVNGTSMSAKTYNDYITRTIGDVNLLIYALNGERFANMTIKDKNGARKVLMLMSDVSEGEIVEGYEDIVSEANGSIDALSDEYKEKAKECDDAIKGLHAVIDNRKSEMAAIEVPSEVTIEGMIDDKMDELLLLDERITEQADKAADAIRLRASKEGRISNINAELEVLRDNYERANEAEVQRLKSKIEAIEQQNVIIAKNNEFIKECNSKKWNKILSLQDDIQKIGKLVLDCNDKRAEVMLSYLEKEAKKCPICGTPYNDDKMASVTEHFEADKERKIADIDKQVERYQKEIMDKSDEIARLQKEIMETHYDQETPLDGLYEELKEVLARPDYSQTEEYKGLYAEKTELEATMPSYFTDYIYADEKEALLDELASLNRQLAMSRHYDKQKHFIDELNAQLREKSNEWAECKGKMESIKSYKEAIAAKVAEKINADLNECRIVMYSKQKNGDVKPDCQIETLDGVLYTTANNSLRARICIDIQKMFYEKIGAELPIFVDEANKFSSGNIPKYDGQMILIKASDDDQLTIKTMEEW